jgi:hypothetical protein
LYLAFVLQQYTECLKAAPEIQQKNQKNLEKSVDKANRDCYNNGVVSESA